MNHEADERDSLDELPGDLRAAIECLKRRPIPDASLQRALDRAGRCGLPVRRIAHRVRQKAVLGFAAAVAACIALGLWFSRPSDLWADVVKAVQAKPWIHGTLPGAKPGQSRELWLSTSRAVGGSRYRGRNLFFRRSAADHVSVRAPRKGLVSPTNVGRRPTRKPTIPGDLSGIVSR